MTFTFYRLRKMEVWDAIFYGIAQFAGATAGVVIAVELFLRMRGGIGPYCARLHHASHKRCIFRHGTSQVRSCAALANRGAHRYSLGRLRDGCARPLRLPRPALSLREPVPWPLDWSGDEWRSHTASNTSPVARRRGAERFGP